MRRAQHRRRRSVYAAGVLVFAVLCDKLFVLLGADRMCTWSDFGGRSEASDKAPVSTALRELDEETLRMVSSDMLLLDEDAIHSKTLCGHKYYLHVALFRGDEHDARAVVSEFAGAHASSKHAEKTELRWFEWAEICELTRGRAGVALRDVFSRTIVTRIREVEAAVAGLFSRQRRREDEGGPVETPAGSAEA
jgi:8-oxo-dGTP pyrophosphatase MutT (NUDIX family)